MGNRDGSVHPPGQPALLAGSHSPPAHSEQTASPLEWPQAQTPTHPLAVLFGSIPGLKWIHAFCIFPSKGHQPDPEHLFTCVGGELLEQSSAGRFFG